tara:strand:+ start:232 stop:372 length:141 start_codon:yes stop_codon:yes gene_type:complete
MEEVSNAHANCQEDEHQFILELTCLNEILDQIEHFDWDYYEVGKRL